MATKKFIDFIAEPTKEELDLVLRLGRDKGKRLMEVSPEIDTRKRLEDELEEISIGHSSEDQVVLLKKRIDELEGLVKFQHNELSGRIDKFFFYATQCFCSQNQKSLDCMTQVYTTLHDISRTFKSRYGLDLMVVVTPHRPGVSGVPHRPGTSGALSSSMRSPRP